MDSPLVDNQSTKYRIFVYTDQIISFIFLLESIIYIIVYGFYFNGPFSYLKDHFFRIDFFIVVTSIPGLILLFSPTSNITGM